MTQKSGKVTKVKAEEPSAHELKSNRTHEVVLYDSQKVISSAIQTSGVVLNFRGIAGSLIIAGEELDLFIGVQTNEVQFGGGATYNDDGLGKAVDNAVNLAKKSLGGTLGKVASAVSGAFDAGKATSEISRNLTGFSLGSGGWTTRRTFAGSDYLTYTFSCKLTEAMRDKMYQGSIKATIEKLHKLSMPTEAKSNATDQESGVATASEDLGGQSKTFNEKLLSLTGIGTKNLVVVSQNPARCSAIDIGNYSLKLDGAGFAIENFTADVSPYRIAGGDFAWANISVTLKSLERPFGGQFAFSQVE